MRSNAVVANLALGPSPPVEPVPRNLEFKSFSHAKSTRTGGIVMIAIGVASAGGGCSPGTRSSRLEWRLPSQRCHKKEGLWLLFYYKLCAPNTHTHQQSISRLLCLSSPLDFPSQLCVCIRGYSAALFASSTDLYSDIRRSILARRLPITRSNAATSIAASFTSVVATIVAARGSPLIKAFSPK